MRHARQQTDITATSSCSRPAAKDLTKKRPQTAKKWAKEKSASVLKKQKNMATAVSKLGMKENNPQFEMDSEIIRLRDEIQQEQQMK